MCLRVERDRQAAVIFKMRTANALRCRPDVQRGGRAFWGRAIQPDPTRTDRSFFFFPFSLTLGLSLEGALVKLKWSRGL